MFVSVFVCIYKCLYQCLCVHASVCISVCVYMQVFVSVCVDSSVCIASSFTHVRESTCMQASEGWSCAEWGSSPGTTTVARLV